MKHLLTKIPLATALMLNCVAIANTNFAMDNNTGRLAGVVNGKNVPSQATTAEAVAMASMPTHAIIHNNPVIQNVKTDVRIFGEQLFRGAFSTTSGSTFNDNYVINVGDNVQVRMWGAYQYAATMTVDPQGNIFLPNVGPVRIAGVRNGQLQSVVQSAIGRIYRSNVGVYASLEQAQPVKVFVTGFVNQPGYYGGLAADSVLSYLDRAGGVDPKRGSYIDVQVLRDGQVAQRINLYDFLIMGRLSPFSFKDGDVINVAPQKQTFAISGRVQNEYVFEFGVNDLTIPDVLAVANPLAEYYALGEAQNIPVQNGDTLVVTSDRHAGTIAVQVTGAHEGNGAVVLPYGARLKDVIAQLEPSALANINHLTIYRDSVKASQKASINRALDRLEEMTLATQSTTRAEAQLRAEDAKLVGQFIAKARHIEPTGRVVVVPNSWQDIILEQGDIIHIPAQTSVIMVNGQVRHQGALTFNADLTVGDYIAKSGGFDNNANSDEILVMHQNGETSVVNTAYRIQQGDEIMVLPKVRTRRVEIARGIAQVIYQLAVATGVIVKL